MEIPGLAVKIAPAGGAPAPAPTPKAPPGAPAAKEASPRIAQDAKPQGLDAGKALGDAAKQGKVDVDKLGAAAEKLLDQQKVDTKTDDVKAKVQELIRDMKETNQADDARRYAEAAKAQEAGGISPEIQRLMEEIERVTRRKES